MVDCSGPYRVSTSGKIGILLISMGSLLAQEKNITDYNRGYQAEVLPKTGSAWDPCLNLELAKVST